MTSLQLGLIIAGVGVVLGVVAYNAWQERRVRRNIAHAFGHAGGSPARAAAGANDDARVEPTLRVGDSAPAARSPPAAEDRQAGKDAVEAGASDVAGDRFEFPIDVQASIPAEIGAELEADRVHAPAEPTAGSDRADGGPDTDIECVVMLQPAEPAAAGALAAGLHARLGKPLRWFGRRDKSLPWQQIKSDTPGRFTDFVACLLLADRTGPASEPLIEAFIRLTGEVAASLPAAIVAPDPQSEAARAETLDRICAEHDVQIGLSMLKIPPATILGTRLRGVAEAAGFRLGDGGRFVYAQEETGATLYSLTNFRSELFSAEMLRVSSLAGVVLVLDVPRVADPARVFDQMKQAARRMTHALDAALVDDNRRPLDDAALAVIRQQIQVTAAALAALHIEPGSPRAMALFGG